MESERCSGGIQLSLVHVTVWFWVFIVRSMGMVFSGPVRVPRVFF